MPPDSALKAREPVARLPSFSALVALGGVAGKLRLDRIPQRPIDDRRVLARIGLSVVNDLAAIDPVLQYQVERAAGEWLPICGRPLSGKGKRWDRCCAWSDAVICPAFDQAIGRS